MPAIQPLFIGIDPGRHGGMAWVCGTQWGVQRLETLSLKEVWEWVSAHKHHCRYAFIEQVGGYISGQATAESSGGKMRGLPGAHMFTFGHSAGSLEMALVAAGIKYIKRPPMVWQEIMGFPPKMKVTKPMLREMAQEMFKNKKLITNQTADALLMAECCRRLKGG